jgi:hypothetical protein
VQPGLLSKWSSSIIGQIELAILNGFWAQSLLIRIPSPFE